ncbi:hypothetical protein [Trinickia soli]|uniref:HPt domain-containing protein n=1 Tax=Trinickia soli TaxID=380675 RepID=A0A2N7VXK6_9BURK|nr:hypothetical protein [Trinickia soli]PMS21892.1 hypothetical protein C0Z19_18180 [Trinickia soli]CAB3650153.1 hypothetical protein LMG24076_00907 [Trinickia soli]
MSSLNRRGCEPLDAVTLDLSELREVYGERDLRMLLNIALDEFDCQRLLFEAAFERKQWNPAAHALHRLTGTVAFFVGDERALEPLSRLERALRLHQVALAERAAGQARATLVAFRAAFAAEQREVCNTTEEIDAHRAECRPGSGAARERG